MKRTGIASGATLAVLVLSLAFGSPGLAEEWGDYIIPGEDIPLDQLIGPVGEEGGAAATDTLAASPSSDMASDTASGSSPTAVPADWVRYEKFGLVFFVPPAFDQSEAFEGYFMVADNDPAKNDSCGVGANLLSDPDFYGDGSFEEAKSLESLPDRDLGQGHIFHVQKVSGELEAGVPLIMMVYHSAEKVDAEYYLYFYVICGGTEAGRVDRLAASIEPGLHYGQIADTVASNTPTGSGAARAQVAADDGAGAVPADWVRHEKFGMTFATPPDFTVETDTAEALHLWAGPPDPRAATPGFWMAIGFIDEDAFAFYENAFTTVTERFEIDLGNNTIFKAKRLVQGGGGVPDARLTLAMLSKAPVAGDKHLVINIGSKFIESEKAFPVIYGIFATLKVTGSTGGAEQTAAPQASTAQSDPPQSPVSPATSMAAGAGPTKFMPWFGDDCEAVDMATWSHPTRQVLETSPAVDLQFVWLCEDKQLPIFGVSLEYDPRAISDDFYYPLYLDLHDANDRWPFDIFDVTDNLDIGVVRDGDSGIFVDVREIEIGDTAGATPPETDVVADIPVGPASGGTTYEKFGLVFTAPPEFTFLRPPEFSTGDSFNVNDTDPSEDDGCLLFASLEPKLHVYDQEPDMTVKIMSDQILGQNERFLVERISAVWDVDVPYAELSFQSANPIENGNHVYFSVICAGSDVGRLDEVVGRVVPSLNYVGSVGAAASTPPAAAAPNAESASPAPAAPSTSAAADPAIELAFWNTIKESTDPADFQAYLDQFPDGVFAGLAKIRITRLGG